MVREEWRQEGRCAVHILCTKWAGSGKRKGGRGITPKPWVADEAVECRD